MVPAGVHATDFGSAVRLLDAQSGGPPRIILDGGFAAWKANAANPVETGLNRPSAKIFSAKLDKSSLVEVAEVETISASGDATLLDGRPGKFLRACLVVVAVHRTRNGLSLA